MTNDQFKKRSLEFLMEVYGDKLTDKQAHSIATGLLMTKEMSKYKAPHSLNEALQEFPKTPDESFTWTLQGRVLPRSAGKLKYKNE